MKRIIYGLLVCTTITWAQEKEKHPHFEESRLEIFAEDLELTETQKGKLIELRKKYQNNQKELRQEHRAENCALRGKKLKEMSKFLTGEQMEELRQKRLNSPLSRMKKKHPKVYTTLLEKRAQFNKHLSISEKQTIRTAREMVRKMRKDAYPCMADKSNFSEVRELLNPIMAKHQTELDEIRDALKETVHQKKGRHMKGKRGGAKEHNGRQFKNHKGEHHPQKMITLFLLMKLK